MNPETGSLDVNDCSQSEVVACYLSHEFRDGDCIGVGSNLVVPSYAALLAARRHGPNIRILVSNSIQNYAGRLAPPALHNVFDFRGTYGAEAYTRHHENFEGIRKRFNVFVGGALQIDPFGNTNLLGLRDGKGGLKFRGPGAMATTSMVESTERSMLYLTRHDPSVFVETCDFITCAGYGKGGPEGRGALGLRGPGPYLVISPKAVFDFPAPAHRMRIRYLQRGVSVAEIVDATGFELEIGEHVEHLPLPTVEELTVLRREVDPLGWLRRVETRRK